MAPIPSLSLSARAALRSLTSTTSEPISDGGAFTALRKRLVVRLLSALPLPPSLYRTPLLRRALTSTYPKSLEERQAFGIITPAYQVQGPSPGTVVGIVLGSVGGFILVIILLWLMTNGNIFGVETTIEADEDIVTTRRRSRSPRSSHRRSRRSTSLREVRQVSRSRSPRPSRIIVEERIRERETVPPPPRPSGIIVEERRETVREGERRVEGDDIVEVTEEHSDGPVSPPRVSRRDSDRRRNRRSSGYRSVDPNLYAGGNYPQHPMRRRDSFSDRS